jgi:hypothetical protein
MLFVDGENFTKRGQEALSGAGIALPENKYWSRGVYLWWPRDLSWLHVSRRACRWLV